MIGFMIMDSGDLSLPETRFMISFISADSAFIFINPRTFCSIEMKLSATVWEFRLNGLKIRFLDAI